MSDKFHNKYRIPSVRLQNWDYRWNAAYFVTICTQGRESYFGEIVDGKMKLSEIGEIVEYEWLKTYEMRPDMNLQKGEFVVMPNHFHAIIIIGENMYNTERGGVYGTERRDAMHCVSTIGDTATTIIDDTAGAITGNTAINESKNKFGTQSKNLASIIRGFKSSVTVNARQIHADFAWQPRFHDHIIRNDDSFQNIRTYISNNPANWQDDKFHNKR